MPPQQNQVPPAAPQQPAPSQFAPVSAQPSQTLAIVALVLGIIGLIPLAGALFAIAAIVVGFIGLSHIKKGIAIGHGMALTGTILGFVGLVITPLLAMTIIIRMYSFFAGVTSDIQNTPLYSTPTSSYESSVNPPTGQ
jgi:hypothetical protein